MKSKIGEGRTLGVRQKNSKHQKQKLQPKIGEERT
jgi:hypothetical protein